MQEIKDRIAEALKLKGKTPKQLSDLTGIPISSISQYMSGHVKPKWYLLSSVWLNTTFLCINIYAKIKEPIQGS